MSKKLVTVMFTDDQADGSVSLYEDGDDLRLTIDAEWSDGRIVAQSATVNQAMAGVLAEEIAHWLKGKDGLSNDDRALKAKQEAELDQSAPAASDDGQEG